LCIMGLLGCTGVVLFNVLLVVATLPAYVIAKVGVMLTACKPFRGNSCRRRAVLVATCLAWRVVLSCCCWVRVHAEGIRSLRRELGASGRPAVIVANHASFMDTILIVTMLPLAKIARIRMLVSAHLLKMPFLGTIVQAMGHQAVPFKSGGVDGGFEIDKELMAVRQRELEEHVAQGGMAGWYPEGTMNRGDGREVGTFRAGGFALAVHLDLEVWCVAFQGNAACWPRTAAVGGRPSRIGVRIFRLCESSHAFITQAGISLEDERAASIHVANSAHRGIQSLVDELAAAGYAVPAEQGLSQPLIAGS